MTLPPVLGKVEFIKVNKELSVSDEEIQARGPRYRVNNKSGAVYMVGELDHERSEAMSEENYLEIAAKFLEENDWKEKDVFEAPIGVRRMISSIPLENASAHIGSFDPKGQASSQKNVQIIYKRVVRTKDMDIDVLGEGGAMTIQMNNDGSILNASKVWRRIEEDSSNMVKVKRFDVAFREAIQQIENDEMYELREDDWAFGYKEASGNVEQTELRAVYQFRFTPIKSDEKTLLEAPPVMIEILAQEI